MTFNKNTIRARFLNSLKRGTGEAYLIMKKYPEVDFTGAIIKAATKNYAYDAQSEGTRAVYMHKLISVSPNRRSIERAVLIKLRKAKQDDYDLIQMFDLALLFYKDGNSDAKKVIYGRFNAGIPGVCSYIGQDEVIEMDGLAGLLKVAERRGKDLYSDKEDWESCFTVDAFQEKNKRIDVYLELGKAARKSKFVNAYLKAIKKSKAIWDRRDKSRLQRFTYEMARERIEQGKALNRLLANRLSGKDIKKLARDFLVEEDQQRQVGYLRIFGDRKFPYDYRKIFELAKKRAPQKSLVNDALRAVTFFKNSEIREFALKIIKTKRNPGEYLELLVNNYRKGDHHLLMQLINRRNNFDYIHSLVGVIDIYRANSTKDCRLPLTAMYSKMNCGLHRADLIRVMDKNNVLPESIFRELEFDSCVEVRDLFKQRKRALSKKNP